MGDLLRPLVVLEGAIVAALLLLLLAWPAVVRAFEARRGRQRRELLAAIREAGRGGVPGDGDGGNGLEAALGRSRPKVLLRALETMEEEGIAPEELALGRLVRATPAFDRVERAARSRLWWRRQTSAQLLGRLGRESEDQPLLVSLLRDPHPAVSAAALLAARELSWPSLAEPLLDLAVETGRASRSRDPLLRSTLSELEGHVASVLLDRLESAAGESDELVLMRIAAEMADERHLPQLRERLVHGGLEVRIQAAKTMAAGSLAGVTEPLRRALEDPAWQVRAQAARGLGRLRAVEAADELRRALSDPSWWVRLRAALALRQLGRAGREILEDVDPAADQYAADMADYVLGLQEAAVEEYAR